MRKSREWLKENYKFLIFVVFYPIIMFCMIISNNTILFWMAGIISGVIVVYILLHAIICFIYDGYQIKKRNREKEEIIK